MKCENCRPLDEVFTHVDEDGVVRHINASAMLRDAEKAIKAGFAEVVETYIEADFIDVILTKRGVEKEKLDRLCEPYLSMPCIGIWWHDGSVLTVDGHHRLVRWCARGDKTYLILIYANEQLENYCIEDFS